ncbi:ABC transporter permease [Cohnella caldifontis]|uniref:ABC transporter permease n=1 Tax=Cohnella caldifontis TaxID=3027471 RepID=UPI0023EAA0B5|nr:ABC transporter permease subunit [Cohnella sp. YIM B05605]
MHKSRRGWLDVNAIKKYRSMYLFLLPAVLVTVIFSYVPMMGLIMAFENYKPRLGYFHSPFVGFAHFREFMTQHDFYLAFKNTILLNGLMILIGFPLPILFALLINEIRFAAFKRVTQTITYLPHFISWVVVSGLVYIFLEDEYGSVNVLLQWLGFDSIGFMREPKYFWGVFVAVSVWKEIGWNSIVFLAALTGIDQEQYEAATIDGAGRFQKLRYITIPGIAPVIGLMFIFTVATIFGANGSGGANFDAIYNMSNPLVMDTALTLDYHVYMAGIRYNNPSYGAAVGMVISALSLFLLLVTNRIGKKISGYGAF